MMRPLGRPPTPSMRSMAREPVESVSTFILVFAPRRMIEPSPNCFVIEERARSMFFSRATIAAAGLASALVDLSALDMGIIDGLWPILPQGNDSGMSGDMKCRAPACKPGVRLNGIKHRGAESDGTASTGRRRDRPAEAEGKINRGGET